MNGRSINLQEVGMLSVDACGVELRDSTFRWIVGSQKIFVYCEERYKGRQARTAMVYEGSTERVLVQPRRRSLVGDKEEPLWPRRDRQAS